MSPPLEAVLRELFLTISEPGDVFQTLAEHPSIQFFRDRRIQLLVCESALSLLGAVVSTASRWFGLAVVD